MATSNEHNQDSLVVGRTAWDLLAFIISKYGKLAIFVIVILLTSIIAISHHQTSPGKDVKIFGFVLYTKSSKVNPDPRNCQSRNLTIQEYLECNKSNNGE